MEIPGEQHWLRVEELGRQLGHLPPEEAAVQISRLAREGESPAVLTLLGTWLALPPPESGFAAGHVIGGRFTLREKLGEGAMGSVWRARQEMITRDVALKMIHPALVTPALQTRFSSEIQALGQLNHPGIVHIFDGGFHEMDHGPPVPFFAMELVEGLPLDRWAEQHRYERREPLRLAAEVCAAVQSAHERRIVHRDLKPSNIFVKPDGHPVVMDFGIARLSGIIAGEEPGLFSGTPLYAAPEQHLGRDGDFRSGESVDVYAIGAILFEMLTGRRLFDFPQDATVSEMRRIVLEERVPRLSEALADCPVLLDEVVSRAVRRDPSDRFYSVAALGRAISRAAETPGPAPTPPAWAPALEAVIPGTQWRLTEKIGEGGTGQVWAGRHDQLGDRCVFKFCDTEEKARTLKRELSLYRLLKESVGLNSHFIRLHEVSLDEPPWYLMMDHADAVGLDAWCDKQPGGIGGLPETVRLEIVAQAAEALQAAHEAGILHRDVKPSNLLVKGGEKGEPVHVFIADFGIGQIMAEKHLREGTRLGFTRTVSDLVDLSLSGTVLYLAPETAEGKTPTARSDIYSLGVVLWQLLIGNLRAALDPADWHGRIPDSHLREDLARCLSGTPEKRWSSAGELAARLRALPDRRAASARRQAELAIRERAAYRRGALRAAAVAFILVALFAALAYVAWIQAREARQAHGEIALKQAAGLNETDFEAGRRNRGLAWMETAATTVTNRAALRSVSAAVMGMAELIEVPFKGVAPPAVPGPQVQPEPRETVRTSSHNGEFVAVGRDVDGENGAVDLIRAATGARLATIERKPFPWVPVPQAGMLCFSPDDKLLAVGGSATSRHVLICNVADGTLNSYLFHGSDPLCCAWHPGGRLFAVGCADGTVRVWDIMAAASPAGSALSNNQFDVPPALSAPAQDKPLQILSGHRSSVQFLAFSPSGRWLASLGASGYLRIDTGFSLDRLPQGVPASKFTVEAQLEDAGHITALEADADYVIVRRGNAAAQRFEFVPGGMPAELALAPDITGMAWNDSGTEICATSLTDIQWLRATPLELIQTASGQNPVGISWQKENYWAIAGEKQITEWAPREKSGAGPWSKSARLDLKETVRGQAELTRLSAAGDGRVAVYCGRRIQFYEGRHAAALSASIVADGGGGAFQEIFWDRPGRLLGVVFKLQGGRRRLESWETTTNFPPVCRALPSSALECENMVPANDGRHCVARDAHRGLYEFDPFTGGESSVDGSSVARQIAPLACSPDGSLVAIVADRSTVRLLAMPSGALFAEFESPRQAPLTELEWDASGRKLAGATTDGYIQVWNLAPWEGWLGQHGLEK